MSIVCKSHNAACVQHQAPEDAGDSALCPFHECGLASEGMRTGSVSDRLSAHQALGQTKA